ncbi:hypothetical protein Bca4012_022314 [Brassica carinata]
MRLNSMLFCGEEDLDIRDPRVYWVYAVDRYCLFVGCIYDVDQENHHMKNIFKEIWFAKDETADLLLTRYLYKRSFHNLFNLKPAYSDTILLVTGDCDFLRTMMDLEDAGKTILLAQPEDASRRFETYFTAHGLCRNCLMDS